MNPPFSEDLGTNPLGFEGIKRGPFGGNSSKNSRIAAIFYQGFFVKKIVYVIGGALGVLWWPEREKGVCVLPVPVPT